MTDEELIEVFDWEQCSIRNSWCLIHDSISNPKLNICVRMMQDICCAEAGIVLARAEIADAISEKAFHIRGLPTRDFDAALPGLYLATEIALGWKP